MTAASRDAYLNFAYAYDQALGRRFHEAVVPLVDWALTRFGPPAGSHFDLACGTGLILEHFSRKGFRSSGVDGSVAMLDVARRRAGALVAGDLRALPIRGKFDIITCLYDSLNHFLDSDDLALVFRGARELIADGGVFLFDMNHPNVYPRVWGLVDPFEAEGDDFFLSMATRFSAKEKLGHASLSGWAIVDGERVEIAEEHTQRAYSEREIVRLLKDAGLAPAEIVDFDPFDETTPGTSRAGVKFLFVVRKA